MAFPFMKLPREMRERAYEFYIAEDNVNDRHPRPVIYRKPPGEQKQGRGRRAAAAGGSCPCPKHELLFHWQRPAVRHIDPALVSKAMHDEFLRCFYKSCVSLSLPPPPP